MEVVQLIQVEGVLLYLWDGDITAKEPSGIQMPLLRNRIIFESSKQLHNWLVPRISVK